MNLSRMAIAMVLALGVGALSACDRDRAEMASTQTFTASLSGADEVPPVATRARGDATMRFDPGTRRLEWEVTYSGLSGPATAAHFHGPAGPGQNAGVALPIGGAGMTSPAAGAAVLTEQQAADLRAGRWYVNVHTAANPGGEIRGQVRPQ